MTCLCCSPTPALPPFLPSLPIHPPSSPQVGFAFHFHNTLVDLVVGAKPAFYIHHGVTLSLIVLSYSGGFQRLGSCVFFVHDIPDIFTSSTKRKPRQSPHAEASIHLQSRTRPASSASLHRLGHAPAHSSLRGQPARFLGLLSPLPDLPSGHPAPVRALKLDALNPPHGTPPPGFPAWVQMLVLDVSVYLTWQYSALLGSLLLLHVYW